MEVVGRLSYVKSLDEVPLFTQLTARAQIWQMEGKQEKKTWTGDRNANSLTNIVESLSRRAGPEWQGGGRTRR